jgi:hypothetical protein
MPLRDHFRPPVSKRSSWEGFHGGWPMRIVEELVPRLPDGFVAEPRVHLGSYCEIDVCAFEQYEEGEPVFGSSRESNVGIATAPQSLPVPTLTLDAEFPDQYAYEVLIFDLERDRRLVAAVELDTWSHPLMIGQPLPSLPIWLSGTQTVVLDLEASYEETCRVLRIS